MLGIFISVLVDVLFLWMVERRFNIESEKCIFERNLRKICNYILWEIEIINLLKKSISNV